MKKIGAKILLTLALLSCPGAGTLLAAVPAGNSTNAFAAFESWANRFQSTAADARAGIVSEGLALAKQRRAALAALVKSDPGRAIALALPDSTRRRLPAEFAAELETTISGVGDLSVRGVLQRNGGPRVNPMERVIRLNGKAYPAYVYGKRAKQFSQQGIPLEGILLDGAVALADVPVEAAGDAVGSAGNPPSAWTTGAKKVLVIRVDFSDLPGDPVGWNDTTPISASTTYTADYVQGIADTRVAPFFAQSSYGLTTVEHTVTTQVYRMPQTAASYAGTAAGNDQLHTDAEAAAAADYNVASFDRVAVLFSFLGDLPNSFITYGGLAELVGKRVWLNGEFDFRVVTHELGHTYGLLHAGLWFVSDGDPISPNGTIIEYGDDFDTMGANYANDARTDFNPYYKNILGWIPDSKVQTASTNGNYRIYAFDTANFLEATNNPILALKFVKDAQRTYWIGARRNFNNNPSMHNGAYVMWGFDSVGAGGGGGFQSGLLDLTTPGTAPSGGVATDFDAALDVKAKFQDPSVGLLITPMGGDNSVLNGYLDVQFGLGSSLSVLTNLISGGNGNGLVDFNECNNLQIVLTNAGIAVSNVTVSISTTTPKAIVAQGFSLYPDIPNGGVAANLVPFRISTAPDFVCGTPVDLTLVIRSATQTRTNFVRLSSGTLDVPVQFTNSTQFPIPDANPAGVSSPIVVSNFNSVVGNVSVDLYITHSFDFDLQLELIAPDGTSVLLSKNNGGAGHNYGQDCSLRTRFDDSAIIPISLGSAPFSGAFKPEQPLSTFNLKSGTNVNGVWQLKVVDNNPFITGAIQCWSLNLSPQLCHDGGGECPGSDLALNVVDSPDPVATGSNLTYTITVTNFGPSTTAALLSQTLPVGATFVSASASQGTVQQSGGTVTCNFGTLGAGAVVKATVVVIPTIEGNASSTLAVASSEADPNLANNSVTVLTRVVPPSADLAVSVTDSPDPIYAGGNLTYTIAVTNRGPTTANSVRLTNTLPSTAVFVSATSTAGSFVNAGGTIIYNLGTIPSGGGAVVTIVVKPTAAGTITETSRVTSDQADLFPANNVASATTTVTAAADLALSIVDSPDPAISGSNVIYVVTVTNRGPDSANNVMINGSLPVNATFATNDLSQGSFIRNGNSFIATLGTLAAGNSATLTLTVTAPVVTSGSQVLNVNAIASAPQADPDSSNNTAEETTLVARPFVAIAPAGSVLTTESFSPANGTVDSGETVSVKLRLRNAGNISTTNMVATLLSSGGVTSLSAPQSYGVLSAGGAAGEKTFSFSANGGSGQIITATLQLADGAGAFTNISFNFTLPSVSTFSNTAAITIPDSGVANPYPSQIAVSNVTGLVDKVTVTLNKMNHTFPDDIDVLLVDPAGRKVLLMGDAGGGNQLAGVNLTFDSRLGAILADEDQLVSGIVSPGNYSPDDLFPNAPGAPYESSLNSLNGTIANGTWSLYVVDDSPGDQGKIAGGWSLAITTVAPVNQIAGLTITPTNSPATVLVNGNATYTFIVSNSGPDVANNVVVNNPLPPNCTALTPTSFDLGSLGVGSNASVTVTLIPGAVGMLTNTATVSGSEIDLNMLNNSASAVTAVGLPVAELGLAISSSSNAIVGHNLTYTISVTNSGPDSAIDVVVTNVLPAGTAFVSASASQGVCSNVGGVITCALGNIGANNSVTISITATPLSVGNLTNKANVVAISTDANLANNSAQFVSIAANPAPSIVASGATLISESLLANGVIDSGETVQIAFALANIGTADTANLVATLQTSGGVLSPSAPQNYGVLFQGGAAVAKTFSFTAAATNSTEMFVTLQLQDGANNLGKATFAFRLPVHDGFANHAAISIPNSGPATPYPSTITISNCTGVLSKVSVSLFNLTHSFPDDLDVILVSPSGQKVLLMSDVGGSHALSGVDDLTFDDSGSLLPDANQIISGIYRPTDYESGESLPSPAPAGPYATSLASFAGGEPNGVWSLYINDDTGGDSGNLLNGWELVITTVETINPAANLAVSISGPVSAATGDSVSYLVTVSNQGPATASSVTLSDVLPANFIFNSAIPSQGTFAVNSGTLICNFGTINSGAAANVTLTGTPTVSGTITNTASATANETDLYLVNNTAVAKTIVINTLPSSLGSATVMSDGNFQLMLTGEPGLSYRIDASSDLSTWSPVKTNACGLDGKFQFTDSAATNFNPRFYRAVRLP